MHSTATDPTTDPSPREKPVTIELRQAEKQLSGSFRPQAVLKLLPSLRTSGLLLALPGEDLKNFLFLLSFLTPNGDAVAALPQLAAAMRVSPLKAKARMQRLLTFQWQGEPLVNFSDNESGLKTYAVNARQVAYEQVEETVLQPPAESYTVAGREAVIARSREHYARPRAAVERQIAQQNGWPLPDAQGSDTIQSSDTPLRAAAVPEVPEPGRSAPDGEGDAHLRGQLKQRLISLGVDAAVAQDVLERFSLVRIQRQLQWLKYRKAKNPAGLVVAAIEDDYEAPAALWHRAGKSHQPRPGTEPATASAGIEKLPGTAKQ